MIRNTDTRSRDYDPSIPRPGTADLTAHIKYKGFQDPRGSGSFSGRLTAAAAGNRRVDTKALILATGGKGYAGAIDQPWRHDGAGPSAGRACG